MTERGLKAAFDGWSDVFMLLLALAVTILLAAATIGLIRLVRWAVES